MTEYAAFDFGRMVWANRRHGGLFRRLVKKGEWGIARATRPDGRVIVEWDNGYTTAAHPSWLSTGAEVDPLTDAAIRAALDEAALFADEVVFVSGDRWEQGWDDALAAVREAMVAHGLTFDPHEIYAGHTPALPSTASDPITL